MPAGDGCAGLSAIGDATLSAATDRMQHEARTLARMRRPRHVVQVMEVGNGRLSLSDGDSEVAFVCMELAEGQSLRTWITSERRPLPSVVAVFRDLAGHRGDRPLEDDALVVCVDWYGREARDGTV